MDKLGVKDIDFDTLSDKDWVPIKPKKSHSLSSCLSASREGSKIGKGF